MGDLDRADVRGLGEDLGRCEFLSRVEFGVVERPTPEVDLIRHREHRARRDQLVLKSSRHRDELHYRARLVDRGGRQVLICRDDAAMRLGDEVHYREYPACPPVLDDGHAVGRLGGDYLLGEVLGHLELERLVQGEHEARALTGADHLGRRARDALAGRPGRHDL